MSDPYKQKLSTKSFFHSKVEMKGKVVVILDGKLENRNLNLIIPISRAFRKYDIIELIGTDDKNAAPGAVVDAIAYIGFVEVLNSGVVLVGDEVKWNDKVMGTIIGFDDTHLPNHQNVIVKVETRISGKDLGMKVGERIMITGF
jgi:hypothetical protein